MNSTENPAATEADDVLIARADARLAHAYEQIARADEQLARVTEKLSKMEHNSTRHPPAVPRQKPSHGRPALRGLIGLLLAACIGVAAFVSQSSYGDAAKLILSRWAPHLNEIDNTRFSGWGSPALPLSSQPATGLSVLAPAQRAGAQRLRALARSGGPRMSAFAPLLGANRTSAALLIYEYTI